MRMSTTTPSMAHQPILPPRESVPLHRSCTQVLTPSTVFSHFQDASLPDQDELLDAINQEDYSFEDDDEDEAILRICKCLFFPLSLVLKPRRKRLTPDVNKLNPGNKSITNYTTRSRYVLPEPSLMILSLNIPFEFRYLLAF